LQTDQANKRIVGKGRVPTVRYTPEYTVTFRCIAALLYNEAFRLLHAGYSTAGTRTSI